MSAAATVLAEALKIERYIHMWENRAILRDSTLMQFDLNVLILILKKRSNDYWRRLLYTFIANDTIPVKKIWQSPQIRIQEFFTQLIIFHLSYQLLLIVNAWCETFLTSSFCLLHQPLYACDDAGPTIKVDTWITMTRKCDSLKKRRNDKKNRMEWK